MMSNQSKIELFDVNGESRGFYSPQNRLNDLTGREWVYWTKSVINQPYPHNLQHKLRSQHGGQKPPDLCGDLIRIFTKSGQLVLDPFAGVGGTLLGATRAGRRAIGVEINHDWIDIYHEVCRREDLGKERFIFGDSRQVLDDLSSEDIQADMILTDVPYWNMDRVSRSRGKYKRVGEEARERKQSKLKSFNDTTYESREHWLTELGSVFRAAIPLLAPRKYLVVFVGDMYNSGEYHMLSADLASVLQDLGLKLKANLIWYDVSKSLHVYGYRYEFIPSMIHPNVLVLRKE